MLFFSDLIERKLTEIEKECDKFVISDDWEAAAHMCRVRLVYQEKFKGKSNYSNVIDIVKLDIFSTQIRYAKCPMVYW